MKERVLITGASGFVGDHLVREALRLNMEVTAAVRPSSKIAHLQELPIRFTSLSFSDPDRLTNELKAGDYQYIIHAAGLTRAKTQAEYDRVNAGFTTNLAISAMALGNSLKKFVFVSSLAALGPVPENFTGAIEANHPPQPVTAYGKSKLLAERQLAELTELPLVVIRPTAVYGPRERDLFIVLRTIAKGMELYIGRNSQKLSFVYVTDLAHAAFSALQTARTHVAYNIADGKTYSKYDFSRIAANILGKKTTVLHLPLGVVRGMARVLETAYAFSSQSPVLNSEKIAELTAENWSCSIRDAETDLHYRPEYDLEKGLAETIRWYTENGWL